jgi:tRNA A37 threonylcarbamoyltransferase TsaD
MAGGAAIGHLAREGDEKRYQLITSKYSAKMTDCSFSFGGMLTNTQRIIEKEGIRCGMYSFLLTKQQQHLHYTSRIIKCG